MSSYVIPEEGLYETFSGHKVNIFVIEGNVAIGNAEDIYEVDSKYLGIWHRLSGNFWESNGGEGWTEDEDGRAIKGIAKEVDNTETTDDMVLRDDYDLVKEDRDDLFEAWLNLKDDYDKLYDEHTELEHSYHQLDKDFRKVLSSHALISLRNEDIVYG